MRRRSTCNRPPAAASRLFTQGFVPAFIASSLVPARATMPDVTATRQMASDMREAAYREGGVTRDGLELLGYTPQQIDALAPAARAIAHQQASLS